jgi:hypothetical protein
VGRTAPASVVRQLLATWNATMAANPAFTLPSGQRRTARALTYRLRKPPTG